MWLLKACLITHTHPATLASCLQFISLILRSLKLGSIIVFLFSCAESSLLCGLYSSCGGWGLLFSCRARAPHCTGFFCSGARAQGIRASVVAAHGLRSPGSWALEHRLTGYGTRAYSLLGKWDRPGLGIEPVSPALAGGLFATEPPG